MLEKNKKALVCTFLTSENANAVINFYERLKKNVLNLEFLIIDNRKKSEKFNDVVDKFFKKAKNVYKIDSNNKSLYDCYYDMLAHAKKYNYLVYCDPEINLTFDGLINLLFDANLKGCVVPIITSENGYESEEIIITDKVLVPVKLSGVPNENTIALAQNCFVVNSEIVNQIDLGNKRPVFEQERLTIHYLFAMIGYKFYFSDVII